MHRHVCGGTGSRTIPSQITRNVSRTFLVVADQPRHLGLHSGSKGVTSLHQLLIQNPNLHITGAILSGSSNLVGDIPDLIRKCNLLICDGGWTKDRISLERSSPGVVGHRVSILGGLQRRSFKLGDRSEEHTSELQSLMRISYAVFCLKKKKTKTEYITEDMKKLISITP